MFPNIIEQLPTLNIGRKPKNKATKRLTAKKPVSFNSTPPAPGLALACSNLRPPPSRRLDNYPKSLPLPLPLVTISLFAICLSGGWSRSHGKARAGILRLDSGSERGAASWALAT
ncbi:hypothetical protein GALMADRAFT_232421 [Galerina marginata CBS 339.88]|uniref:Uncharacterized protein n=1 Tax=Galerina marginata (strain CBS 339.88) TaxID=685588 RepID=A0A067S9B9_GALM3|nr:hypothetical protein GALMADRAFT_232421 [Galerina marginata CBS 339.88]